LWRAREGKAEDRSIEGEVEGRKGKGRGREVNSNKRSRSYGNNNSRVAKNELGSRGKGIAQTLLGETG